MVAFIRIASQSDVAPMFVSVVFLIGLGGLGADTCHAVALNWSQVGIMWLARLRSVWRWYSVSPLQCGT